MEERSANVIVLSAKGPETFYVRLKSLQALQTKLKEFLCEQAEISEQAKFITRGEIYFLKNDGEWYRVQAMKLNEQLQLTEVFFIDYGNTEVVDQSYLFKCNKYVTFVQAQALRCSLINSSQINCDVPSADLTFKFLVSRRRSFKMIVKEKTEDIYIVDLVTLDRDQNYSIYDFLRSQTIVSDYPTTLTKTVEPLKIPDGSAVTIRHVNTPSDFFVALDSLKLDEKVMREEMDCFYASNPLAFTFMAPGVLCAMRDEHNRWNRVKIIQTGGVSVPWKVLMIDIGEEKLVSFDELFELDSQFYEFPRFTKRCSLAGVQPIGEAWTSDKTEIFCFQLKHCSKPIELINVPHGVKLYVNYKGFKININKALIHFKHASASPGSSDEELFVRLTESESNSSNRLHPIQENEELKFPSKFTELQEVEQALNQYVQQNVPGIQEIDWKVGDKCLVLCGDDDNHMWLQGVIKKLQHLLVIVELSDCGTKVFRACSSIRQCPQEVIGINSMVTKVHLVCSPGSEWNDKNFDAFIKLIKHYHKLYIAFKDNKTIQFATTTEARPAILWGQSDCGSIQNIINVLEEKDLVVPAFIEKAEMQREKHKWTIVDYLEAEKIQLKPEDIRISHGEINDIPLKFEITRVKSWLPIVPNTRSTFIGLGTYVTIEGFLVLHDLELDTHLEKVNEIINKFFKQSQRVKHQFKVGDPCIVQYASDNKFYRGEVTKVEGEYCDVYFIDYGNSQRKMKSKYLHADVICAEIPPFAQKYRLGGIVPLLNGEKDQELLDKLHHCIVDASFDVIVHADDIKNTDPNYIKRCGISIDHRQMKSYQAFQIYASAMTRYDPHTSKM